MAGPSKKLRVPKLSRHPKTGQAYVTWEKKRHYMGVWGKPETEERYRRFVAGLAAPEGPVEQTATPPDQTVIVELCAAFLQHAQTWYVKDGEPTAQLGHVKLHIKILRDRYGSTPIADFGPLALQKIQRYLVAQGCTRPGVNSRVQGIRRIFKWGVSQELVPPSVYHALACVPGLRKGRTQAPECPLMPVWSTFSNAIARTLGAFSYAAAEPGRRRMPAPATKSEDKILDTAQRRIVIEESTAA